MHLNAWLRVGLGLGLALSAGCLYNTAAIPESPAAVQSIQPPVAEAARPVPPASPAPRSAPEKDERAASAIEPPPDPFKVEMGPAPLLPDLSVPPTPPPDKPLVAALRGMLEKNPEDADAALEKIEGPRKKRLLALLKVTAGVSEGEIENLPADEAASLLEHLREVGASLTRSAPLQLRGVRYCRSIKGFGQYEPAGASPTYHAGATGQPGERVQVYAEVRHFRTRDKGGSHETKLAASLEVMDSKGKRVASLALGTCSDKTQSPRQDYFLNCQFNIPAGLEPGTYTLWLTVRDVTVGKPREAMSPLELRVVPPVRAGGA